MSRIFTFALICAAFFASTACSDDDSAADKTYKTGDFYNEKGVRGVVFKTSDAGRHGLVVSLDEKTVSDWAGGAAAEQKTGAVDQADGAVNQMTVEMIAGWQTKFTAFAWCAAKNMNSGADWYLPAFYELADLYQTYDADREAFDACLIENGGAPFAVTGEDNNYWSSTENLISGKEREAAVFGFYEGIYSFLDKSYTARVRAVHKF